MLVAVEMLTRQQTVVAWCTLPIRRCIRQRIRQTTSNESCFRQIRAGALTFLPAQRHDLVIITTIAAPAYVILLFIDVSFRWDFKWRFFAVIGFRVWDVSWCGSAIWDGICVVCPSTDGVVIASCSRSGWVRASVTTLRRRGLSPAGRPTARTIPWNWLTVMLTGGVSSPGFSHTFCNYFP